MTELRIVFMWKLIMYKWEISAYNTSLFSENACEVDLLLTEISKPPRKGTVIKKAKINNSKSSGCPLYDTHLKQWRVWSQRNVKITNVLYTEQKNDLLGPGRLNKNKKPEH